MTKYCVRYRSGHSRLWRVYCTDTRTGLWAFVTGLRPFIEVDREWEETEDEQQPSVSASQRLTDPE